MVDLLEVGVEVAVLVMGRKVVADPGEFADLDLAPDLFQALALQRLVQRFAVSLPPAWDHPELVRAIVHGDEQLPVSDDQGPSG